MVFHLKKNPRLWGQNKQAASFGEISRKFCSLPGENIPKFLPTSVSLQPSPLFPASALKFAILCSSNLVFPVAQWWRIILQYRSCRRWVDPWVGKIPWRRPWQSSPAFLSGEFYGQRSLAGYSPWDGQESDTTETSPHACSAHSLQRRPGGLSVSCVGSTAGESEQCWAVRQGSWDSPLNCHPQAAGLAEGDSCISSSLRVKWGTWPPCLKGSP